MSRSSFMVQQPAFALDTAAITYKRSTRSDNAVAWHDNSDWIRTIRKANRPDRLWPSDPLGKFPV
jgi:hypothetical protein